MDGFDSAEVRIAPFGQVEITVVIPAETTARGGENEARRSKAEVKILEGSTATERVIVSQANPEPYANPLSGAVSASR